MYKVAETFALIEAESEDISAINMSTITAIQLLVWQRSRTNAA
jgi:hypothetical protein